MKKLKILYIISGPAAPGNTKNDNYFYYLSRYFFGSAIGSTWSNTLKPKVTDKDKFKEGFGDFKYETFKYYEGKSIIRQLVHIFSYIRLGMRLGREEKFDVIVSYGFNAPGIAASILSFLMRTPLIVLSPGVPSKILKYTSIKQRGLSKFLLEASIKFTLKQASSVWLLFKGQLGNKFNLENKKVFINHDFAPVSLYKPREVEDNIISFIGYPWELKGVYELIEAFKIVLKKFPNAKLKLAGYCPDRTKYENQVEEIKDSVEFLPGLNRKECIEFICSTKFFVLPSKTEGMGRVLLEAMAAEKTVIASNVDGIPHYLDDNVSGLLFETYNINDLASKLELVLSDNDLAKKLAKNAREKVLAQYTELDYANNFKAMVEKTLKD